MWSENEASQAIGKTVYSGEGDKIGKVGQVFLDDQTGQPEFLTVNTGHLRDERVVRACGGRLDHGDDVSVPYGKDKVKDAPRVDVDWATSPSPTSDGSSSIRPWVRRRYGTGNGPLRRRRAARTRAARTQASRAWAARLGDRDLAYAGHQQSAGHDTSGPNTDDAMTRSEEHLDVGTTSQAGRSGSAAEVRHHGERDASRSRSRRRRPSSRPSR